MKRVMIMVLIFMPVLLFGQTEYDKYNWETFPAVQNTDTLKCVNGAAVLLERRIFETYVNPNKDFEEIFVFHRKIKVDSNNGLSSHNKIYISLDDVIDIINIQARFTAPNGKITELPKESIKQIANMDNDGDYKTFAIEGAEVGGSIEYFYVLRKKFVAHGGYFLQERIPKSNVEVLFAFPSKISFQIKGYNNLPKFKINEQNAGKTIQRLFVSYMPTLEEEKYANYKAGLMRFEYTLAYNHYNSSLRKNSWKKGCENIYSNLYDLSKNDKAAVQELCRQIVPEKGDVGQKVRAIENWIKSNLNINKDNPGRKDLEEVIRLKQANIMAGVKLFVAMLLTGNIQFEFISTGKNSTSPFDPDFNCMNFMNHNLIYFPQLDKYLVPDDLEYRLGLIPEDFQGEYGLFMHPVSYNDKLTVLGYEIRKIPVQENSVNTDSMLINLSLSPQQTEVQATIHRFVKGARGKLFQNLFYRLPEEKNKEIIEQLFRMGKENSSINSIELKNGLPNDVGVRPFQFEVTLKAGQLIENAGSDLLVHIGESIGRQAELYQEHTRKLPVHIGILHNYYRRIEFEIPAGYKVANPENLDMNVSMKNGDRIGCIFTSQAQIKGDRLIVISQEYYNDETYPASRYNEFRDVINASADFNKRSILLKKL